MARKDFKMIGKTRQRLASGLERALDLGPGVSCDVQLATHSPTSVDHSAEPGVPRSPGRHSQASPTKAALLLALISI